MNGMRRITAPTREELAEIVSAYMYERLRLDHFRICHDGIPYDSPKGERFLSANRVFYDFFHINVDDFPPNVMKESANFLSLLFSYVTGSESAAHFYKDPVIVSIDTRGGLFRYKNGSEYGKSVPMKDKLTFVNLESDPQQHKDGVPIKQSESQS